MEHVLKSSGYHIHPGSRVFTKGSEASINYSDGEGLESGLLLNLKNTSDLSTLSFELMEKCTDWFHSYHLSSARANLLRPFKQHFSGTVLELGAGCGAITRYLGECASSVVAVEGTLQRSLICSERTRDQPNVFVIQSELSELVLPVKFDTVVVVGVLEYAALFSDSPEPHLEFLENAKRHLKPDGTLFLAIENKLGLKYFAGSPEDHVGVPMFGLEDKYEVNGVRTFSKKAITKIFRQAGFEGIRFHYPLPDYKLTRAVLSQEGIDAHEFDSAAFSAQLVNSDAQIPLNTHFDLRGTWNSVAEAGLEDNLANSFLIEACIAPATAPTHDKIVLGNWYSGIRRPQFMHEKEFSKSQNGKVIVRTKGLASGITNHHDYAWAYSTNKEHEERYFNGPLYATKVLKTLSNGSLTGNILSNEVREFLHLAKNFAHANGWLWSGGFEESSLIDGRFIDALPRNSILVDDSEIQFFDVEWEVVRGIELGRYLYRIVGDIYDAYSERSLVSPPSFLKSKNSLVEEMWKELDFNSERIEEWEHLELTFDAHVRGTATHPLPRVRIVNPEKDAALQVVRASWSWKLTKPLRWLGSWGSKSPG